MIRGSAPWETGTLAITVGCAARWGEVECWSVGLRPQRLAAGPAHREKTGTGENGDSRYFGRGNDARRRDSLIPPRPPRMLTSVADGSVNAANSPRIWIGTPSSRVNLSVV